MVASDAQTVSLYHHLWLPFWDAVRGVSANADAFKRHAKAFPGAMDAAAAHQHSAMRHGFEVDDGWPLRSALTEALDRRDDWRGAWGSIDRLAHDVVVTGQWPKSPFVALGTHWGAGMPTLAHLCAHGLKPRFVYRQEPDSVFTGAAARLAHRQHLRAIDRFGGAIRVGGAYAQIMEALATGATPVILIDAPAEGRPTLTGRGHSIVLNVRSGLLDMLCREQIRCVFYRCGFDPKTGVRQLHIGPECLPTDPQAIADQAACHLDLALQFDSAQWRLWMVADALIHKASV